MSPALRSTAVLLSVLLCLACADDPATSPRTSLTPNGDAGDLLNSRQLDLASFGRAFLGGGTTVFDSTVTAFGHPAPNLDATALLRHDAGDNAFETAFDLTNGRRSTPPQYVL